MTVALTIKAVLKETPKSYQVVVPKKNREDVCCYVPFSQVEDPESLKDMGMALRSKQVGEFVIYVSEWWAAVSRVLE